MMQQDFDFDHSLKSLLSDIQREEIYVDCSYSGLDLDVADPSEPKKQVELLL